MDYLTFPIEFFVRGTAVSLQAKRSESKEEWKSRVRAASAKVLPADFFSSESDVAVTLYYMPAEPMQGDVDNIVKPILDALNAQVWIDDKQVARVVVQKFEPGNVFQFSQPTEVMIAALATEAPVLYVRLSDKPFEDLR